MNSAPSAPALAVEDLHVGFPTRRGLVRAVDGVSFSLEAGRTLAIVGESGSGKSTITRAILRLLAPSAVVTGRIAYRGSNVLDLNARGLRALRGSSIRMVFQDPMSSLNPVQRIEWQIVEAFGAARPSSHKEAHERCLELLASVGVADPPRVLQSYPHELSGGMRQRVMIAMALACDPQILLADEPTTALDVTIQAQILDLLVAQQRKRAMAMILVTHDLGVAVSRADDIAVMYAGKIVEKGPSARVFRSPRMPYSHGLIGSMLRLSDPGNRELAVIPGRPPDASALGRGCRFAPRCHYAQERCLEQQPGLSTAEDAHSYACYYPLAPVPVAEPVSRQGAHQ